MVRETVPTYRIIDLDESERPRERLAGVGAESLSTAELLAILLRVGLPGENALQIGRRLLQDFNGLSGLQRASFHDLSKQHGMGVAKAAQIKAAIELGQRVQNTRFDDRHPIQSPKEAADRVMYEMGAFDHEEFWVMVLNTRNHLIHTEHLYKGSLNSSTVRMAEIFRSAIQHGAAGIILVHNHPSGDPTPSPEDVNLTRSAVQSGRLLDIEVLDHLVIGLGNFISLKERGLGF